MQDVINASEYPDVVLINPNNRDENYNNLGDELAAYEPPAWCLMLAGYLQNKGKTVKIIDANLEGLTALETASQALFLSAKVIAIVVYGQNPSSSTQLMPGVISLSKTLNSIRRYYEDTTTILIGGHIAALPEQSLRETEADYVCLGEGFDALNSLVRLNFNSEDHTLNGFGTDVGFLDSEGKYTTFDMLRAPLIQNLDKAIPRLPWELLDMSQYKAHNWHTFGYDNRTPYAAFYTTLGCPYSCEFCCIGAPFKSGEKALNMKQNSYRSFSVNWVMNQFEELHKLGITHIKIIDELFLFDIRRVTQICDRLTEKDYNFNIRAYARLNILNKDILSKMKRAGFNWLAPGIESADSTIRNNSNKCIKQIDIYEGIKKLQDAGISIAANYIFGLPDDNYYTMQATLDMAIELNTEWSNFNTIFPFPGSKLYTDCLESGTDMPKDWSEYSFYSKNSAPMNTKYLTGLQVREFRDKAFTQYFDRKEYKEIIFSKFGQCAVDEVVSMLSLKINR